MPVFHLSAGPVRRLAAVALLSFVVAGCAAAGPALPELQGTAGNAAVMPASVLADYQPFAPGPRDDWRQARIAGGMTMTMDGAGMDQGAMDHGAMDHGTMDHGTMDHGGTDSSATSMDHQTMQHAMPAAPAAEPPADAPAHKH